MGEEARSLWGEGRRVMARMTMEAVRMRVAMKRTRDLRGKIGRDFGWGVDEGMGLLGSPGGVS